MSEPRSLREPRRFSLGASPAHRRMTVAGVDIAYDDRGRGFPLIGMHAITHGSGDFVAVAEALAARWRFVSFDWPGQGRSGPDAMPPTAQRCGELLAGLLDALRIERAVLIGNSIGGAAALHFAVRHPDRVAALVLADPGGLIPMSPLGRRVCGAMAALGRAGQRRAFYFQPLFALLYRQLLRTPAARAQRARIIAAAAECAAIWEAAWLGFRLPEADQSGIGPAIKCPVLFTWARRDPLVSYALSKAAVARFPNHKVVLFNGGHSAFLEEPEAFLREVTAFLQGVDLAQSTSPPLRAVC